MTLQYEDAVDAIFKVFNDRWLDVVKGSGPIVGSNPPIFWQGNSPEVIPDGGIYWARVTQATGTESQATLATDPSDGTRRYETDGTLLIQIFTPMSEVDHVLQGRLLAKVARNAYRGKTSATAIMFRNARIQEVGISQEFKNSYEFAIMVDYEYDECT